MTREGIKMINDEAKSVLFNMLGKGIYVKDTKENQAILVALRALEQEPCEDWYDVPSDEMTLGQARQAVRDLRKIWAEHLEQESCGKDINVSTTDAIDRDELLKAMDTWDKFGYTETGCFVREPKNDCVKYIHYDDVIKCIKGMPSVTSQQKNMTREKTCKNCINSKECVMYEPNMKRCKEYKADQKEIYNKGFADGQKALAEHMKLCKEELLYKIRVEIDEQYDRIHPNNIYTAEGLEIALDIIDKYKTESEVQDATCN